MNFYLHFHVKLLVCVVNRYSHVDLYRVADCIYTTVRYTYISDERSLSYSLPERLQVRNWSLLYRQRQTEVQKEEVSGELLFH